MNGKISARFASAGILAAAMGVFLLTLGGCATPPPPKPEQVKPAWPDPPLTARIQFVRSITSDEDLGRDTTFSENLINFLAGNKPPPNRIGEPNGIAVSDDGNRVYVADTLQSAVFVFDFEKKSFLKIDGIAQAAGIGLDAQENIYVVAPPVKQIVKYDRNGKRITEFTDPSLERPIGLAVDKVNKRVYVVDTGTGKSKENTVKIFDLDGNLTGQIGQATAGKGGAFFYPTYVTVDSKGNVYVADTFNSRVQQFDVDGKFLRTFGGPGDAWGNFDKVKGVAVDTFGNLYAVDTGWSNVQMFNPTGQVLMFFGGRGTKPGFLGNPTAIAVTPQNRIYVGDYFNHRVEVYDLVNTTAADSFLKPPSNNPVARGGPAKPAAPAGTAAPAGSK